jgi:glycosyltransferase involved in cell wall biosynthesis
MWNIVYKRGNFLGKTMGILRGQLRRVRDLFRLRRYDIVYVFMWVTPLGTSMFERLVRVLSRKLIYDIEDNLLIKKNNAINPMKRFLSSVSKPAYLIRTADHVISSSPFLNEICMESNARKCCTYVSSSVDTRRYVPKNAYANDRRITIGWTGTFSTRPYLDLLSGVFQQLSQRCDFRLRVIGNFDYELPGVDLEVIQWTEASEVEDLQAIDIGVYPLPDDEWVLGKSGLKAIQYMAFGLPTVATNVGTTPRIISHMRNGWLVNSPDEWLIALESLIRDPALRRRLGEAARTTVLENYSIDAIKSTYSNILASVSATLP